MYLPGPGQQQYGSLPAGHINYPVSQDLRELEQMLLADPARLDGQLNEIYPTEACICHEVCSSLCQCGKVEDIGKFIVFAVPASAALTTASLTTVAL